MQAEQIVDHRTLMELVRLEATRQPETTAEVVGHWFDLRGDDWVAAVLDAELGSHQSHHEAFRLLSVAQRALLVARVADVCRAQGRRGLGAGSFMVGRFVSASQPVQFWNDLSDAQVASVLDEWVQYLAYLALLDEVGSRKLRLARQRIEERGLPTVQVRKSELRVFASLKLSQRSLERVAASLENNHTEPETGQVIQLLSEPYGRLFDYAAPWSLTQLQELCDEAGLPLPRAEDR